MPETIVADSAQQTVFPNTKIGRIGAALAAYEVGNRLYERGKDFWRTNLTYSVTVRQTDRLYGEALEWLLTVVPDRQHRALEAFTVRGAHRLTSRNDGMESVDPGSSKTPKTELATAYSDKRPHTVDLDGHRIKVHLRSPGKESPSPANAPERYSPEPDYIEFVARTPEGQAAVLAHLDRMVDATNARRPALRVVGNWGHWQYRNDLPLRSMDSVILPTEQKDRVVADLGAFLDAEERYNRLAVPWHRGYLLHGPPGTGKTSLVKALANEFGLDLWYVPMADLSKEANLMSLLGEVGPRSLLLLEDIDTLSISHEENSSEPGQISLSSLLNALDGVATPHGLVTVMTTNHFERLDERLVRAGRMDRVEELVYPTWTEVGSLYRHFYGETLPDDFRRTVTGLPARFPDLSQAAVSEVFKRHLDDRVGADAELAELIATAHKEEALR